MMFILEEKTCQTNPLAAKIAAPPSSSPRVNKPSIRKKASPMNLHVVRLAGPPENRPAVMTVVVMIVVDTSVQNAKCIRQLVLLAAKRPWFLLNRATTNRSSAATASSLAAADPLTGILMWSKTSFGCTSLGGFCFKNTFNSAATPLEPRFIA